MTKEINQPMISTIRPLRTTRRSLPIALLRSREKVMGPIRNFLNEAGISEQKWRILRVLEENGGMGDTAIAEASCLLLPSLTRILRTMENDGLVTRQEDNTDRRRSIVSITESGRMMVFDHLKDSDQYFKRLEKAYGKEKLEQLLDLLEELNHADF